ncbi:MAG: hypothetical protein KKB37_15610, partial [Alphaproteobacteria bacterium]|nr:hypothetical protein [Alphaproteobacteria bacterium]
LHLTAEAERMHALIWPLAEATVEEALSDLSSTERKTLSRLMRSVKGRLLELAEDDPIAQNTNLSEDDLVEIKTEKTNHVSV